MKGKARTLAALFLVIALLLVAVPFSSLAAGNKVDVKGTLHILDKPPDLPPDTVEVLGNGKYRISEWTLNEDQFDDARLSGLETMHFRCIVDMNTGSGTAGGATEIMNEAGGWSGQMAGGFDNWTLTWHVTLVGSGAYKGLVASLDYAGFPGETFQITGYIVETGAYR